ncbi:MAG: hypothetical protein KKH04_09805 [Proteobacteria bacterium]|nr:hypothetical protein [Pseudomonadota bacterium]
MKSSAIPAELRISLKRACSLSLECWRLRRLAEQVGDANAGSVLRHVIRRITEILEDMGIEVVDFVGRTYDPGMVSEVVEVREDQALLDGDAIIDETIAPTVIWRGQVVSSRQIIVKRSTARLQESSGVGE